MTESARGCGWTFGAGGARLNPKTEKEAMRAKAVVRFGIGVAGVCSMFLAGCMVGPKYAKPSVAAPPAYKELTPENLKDTDGWKASAAQRRDVARQMVGDFRRPRSEQPGRAGERL